MNRIGFLQDILASVFVRSDAEPEAPDEGSFAELCDALLSDRGEMSAMRLAHGLLGRFEKASEDERVAFFELLATRFDINAGHALRAARRYAELPTAAHLAILTESVEPRRLELLRRLNQLPGATARLVRMREALLVALSAQPDLARIDLDFRHLFRAWFNRGFLVLREIDWRTPANVLEKIIAYEAVHAIDDWEALRARLEPVDRRCYAFFHPAMPDEPLIFVEVALTAAEPAAIGELLAPERVALAAEAADTAVFYSISNCQAGLAGVSFGNFLIKQVAAELARELPALETFRTLSPVPGLMRWVRERAVAGPPRAADAAADDDAADGASPPPAPPEEALALATAVAAGERGVADETEREALARLVAHYLVHAKRADGFPLDPVARFHLGNGASLDAVLPVADPSAKGLAASAGAMVSYRYDLGRVEANHEAYADGRTVATSPAIGASLAPPKRARRRA